MLSAARSEESHPVAETEVRDDVARCGPTVSSGDSPNRFVDVALGLDVERQMVPPVGVPEAIGHRVVNGVPKCDFDEREVGIHAAATRLFHR